MNAIISLREVTKRFRETVALDKVIVDFEAGKIHGIVGRNGSGKTVLMKCVCGLMHQDAGEILVRGQRVGKDVDIPQGIGAIIEAPGFLPNFSGYRNLKFLADIRRQVGKERVRWAMETVGLDPDSPKHVTLDRSSAASDVYKRQRPSSWPATAVRTSPCCATRSTKWTAAACSSERKSRAKKALTTWKNRATVNLFGR